ncbi:P-loop containing nucleoside triphosphate hydrolase protein [Daedalea quercina L-15889]|uniref:p-loop containing nucleoside triphosphate hydrolase protein n=1 Tax=Daedalea quercina L-15889 TaxID=1314783 RepID=A0A165PXN6_9APHY|nr:P-loop containing nucleoside triphosphate hydrolase protein [Daedalea quercina L-15889]
METMKESIETNKSLSVLKDCVRAVSFGDSHIPWRGSRLTMALKNIFDRSRESGERANKLLIVACVSPSPLDVEDTLGTLRYVAVFQLGDLVHHSELKGVTRTVLDEPVTKWDHDQSVDYIKRNWSKLTPVLNRLLPSPSSTMADLLPLSVTELSQLCATPAPGETRGKQPTPDARSVAQAKSWVATYKVKMDALVQKAQTMQQGAEAGSSANAAKAALDALSGRDFMAGETGSVTRVDARGRVMHNAKLK